MDLLLDRLLVHMYAGDAAGEKYQNVESCEQRFDAENVDQ